LQSYDGTGMSVFSTDPSFCPHCGTILPLPGAGDIVICKLCDFQQDTSGETCVALGYIFVYGTVRRYLTAPFIINALHTIS